jgi:hypothetical protein
MGRLRRVSFRDRHQPQGLNMNKPRVGDIVHYFPLRDEKILTHGDREPLAAIIVCVWDDNLVNVTVFDAAGHPQPRTSVPLYGEVEPGHVHTACARVLPDANGEYGRGKQELDEDDIRVLKNWATSLRNPQTFGIIGTNVPNTIEQLRPVHMGEFIPLDQLG